MKYNNIKTPYLIQRAKWKLRPNLTKIGIDQIIEFDYMGSTEFEWGALPKSLKRIRSNVDSYIWTHTEMYSIFSKRTQVTDIMDAITKLSLKEIHTKEFTAIKEGMFPDSTLGQFDYDYGFRIWWDIENDFFIFSRKGSGKKDFTSKIDRFYNLILTN